MFKGINLHIRGLFLMGLLLSGVLNAEEIPELKRLSINFSTDGNGNINPQIFIPLTYSTHLYSGVGYESSDSISTESASDDTDLGTYKYSDSVNSNHFWLNVLSYEDSVSRLDYSIGALASYKLIKLNQFGYLFKTGSGATASAVPFNNDRKLEAFQAGVYFDVGMKEIADIFSFRLGAYAYPYMSLKVDHELEVIGVVQDRVSSTTSQQLSYRAIADVYIKTTLPVDLSFSGLYESEPLSYDMVRGQSDGSYKAQSVETSSTRLRIDTKLVFNTLKVATMSSMVGYGYESTTSGVDGEASTTLKENLFLVGFEKKF